MAPAARGPARARGPVSDFQAIVAIAAVRASGWSAAMRSVFIMMALRASVDGDCWASAVTIGVDCGYDERTARRMMDALATAGAIVGRARPGQSTVWRLQPQAIPCEPRVADPGQAGQPIRGPRVADPGTPGPRSGVTPDAQEGPRAADPKTPGGRSEDPGSAPGNPGRPIRRSLYDPSIDPSMDPSTQLEGGGVASRITQALARATELQRDRARTIGDVEPVLTKQDEQHVARWVKTSPPYGPADFALVWAYFAASDEFQPSRARVKGHFRWATLCNDKYPDRVRLARAWEARGRRDLEDAAAERAPPRSRPVDRASDLDDRLARIAGRDAHEAPEDVILTVIAQEHTTKVAT